MEWSWPSTYGVRRLPRQVISDLQPGRDFRPPDPIPIYG
jgi:hypothetical protein